MRSYINLNQCCLSLMLYAVIQSIITVSNVGVARAVEHENEQAWEIDEDHEDHMWNQKSVCKY